MRLSKSKPFFEDPKSQYWHRQPLEKVPLCLQSGEFYQLNSKTLKMEMVMLEFNKSFLIRSKSDQSIKVDTYNAIIRLIQGPKQGISIIKSGYQYQFFGKITEWYNALKHYCIQVNFEEKYEYVRLLSTGTYSKVYEINELHRQTRYAAKVYDKSLLNDEKDRITLLKEIDILRNLSHPGVIKLEEVYENQDQIILIFEYLDGGDLQKYLRKKGKAISESILKRIASKLLNTLKYIHSKGILHRDIKLANIMLRGDEIILTDFGMAEFYREDGQYMYQRCGTAGFVAPEILQNQPYDLQVDIYSLGVVLYILVAGRHPFKASTYDQTLYLNSVGEINFNINVTPSCINFLQGMLTPDKQNRLQIPQLLEHSWLGVEKLFDRKTIQSYKLLPKQLGSQKNIITEQSPPQTSRSPFNLYKITPYYLPIHKENSNQALQNKLKKIFSQSLLRTKSKSPDPKNQITFQFTHYGGGQS